jgi:uncharacterized protein YvpB
MSIYQHKDVWLTKLEGLMDRQQEIPSVSAVTVFEGKYDPLHPLNGQMEIAEEIRLKAPLIKQYPELPRGCEVTSLAMLLLYSGFETDKMKLAEEVKRDDTPYKVKDGKTYFGNPNKGFVGDMYSLTAPGYGVYHKPLAKLASQYAGDQVVDLTGNTFYSVIASLNKEQPVLVIINAQYKKLPESAFKTWHTPDGPVEITMNEHAVLVTGYDEKYIYFNDPLARKTKAPYQDFVEAWEQMGKQAITIEKESSLGANVRDLNIALEL